MDIDIRVNTVHGPVFDDVEVSPAALLTYSEHMFADIHGNVSGAHYDVNVLCFVEREIMPDKLRKVLLPFLAGWRQCLLAQCDRSRYGILYRFGYTELVSIVTILNIRHKFRCVDMLCSLEANLLKCLWSYV